MPTRIERLAEGKYDAIVLATAGLLRLDLAAHIAARIETSIVPPAVSQGAIGVCARAGDERSLQWVRGLEHPATRVAVTAERALLRRIEGGCQVPLGALATLSGNRLTLRASVCALDGSMSMDCDERTHLEGSASHLAAATALGSRVAELLLARGAGIIIAEQRRPANQDLP